MENLICVYCSHDIDSGDHCGCYVSPMHRDCRSTHDHEFAALIDGIEPTCIDCCKVIESWSDVAASPKGIHHRGCLANRIAMEAIEEHGDWNWEAIAHERHPRTVAIMGEWIACRICRMPALARSIDAILSLVFDR